MDQLGLRSILVAHMAEVGIDVTDANARIRASQIHILLASLTYCAYEGRLDDLVGAHARLLTLLDDELCTNPPGDKATLSDRFVRAYHPVDEHR